MSIFGRKEIAELKKELDTINKQYQLLKSENSQLNEKCSRYESALKQADKEHRRLIANCSAVSVPVNDELSRLKEKCNDYKVRLDRAERQAANYKQNLLDVQVDAQKKFNKLESISEKQIVPLNVTNDAHPYDIYEDVLIDDLIYSSEEQEQKDKKPIYKIQDNVRANPNYMGAIYLSKGSFLTPNEFKMYCLLENFAYNNCHVFGSLSIFANTRLADFIELFEDSYDGKKGSFCKQIDKNSNKKAVCETIDKLMPYFSNEDYKLAFLYPLFRMHVDFLICADEDNATKPILAIELYGSEHDPNSKQADWKTIYNDKFKKSLISEKNKAMGVRLLVIKNEELDDEDKLNDKIYNEVERCLQIYSAFPEPVGNRKWNKKVYGSKGNYYVFIDNRKLNITNETAENLKRYVNKSKNFS